MFSQEENAMHKKTPTVVGTVGIREGWPQLSSREEGCMVRDEAGQAAEETASEKSFRKEHYGFMPLPPCRKIVSPVMYSASSLARNTHTRPTSFSASP